MKKTLRSRCFAALIAATGLFITVAAYADPDACIGYAWDPITGLNDICLGWQPTPIPGSHACLTDPPAGYVNVYQGTNYTGACQALPVGTNVADLSVYGWNNSCTSPTEFVRIDSFKTAPGTAVVVYPLANYRCAVGGPCGGTYGSHTVETVRADATKLYSTGYPTVGSLSVVSE